MNRLSVAMALPGIIICLNTGCQKKESPVMDPGQDCLSCHRPPGSASPTFSVAGTVYSAADSAADSGKSGVSVSIVDSTNRTLTLQTNSAGNFYTAESLTPPFQVEVSSNGVTEKMIASSATGACNTCHNMPPTDQASGRIYSR